MDRYDQQVVDTAAEKSEVVCRAFGPQSPECVYERQRAQMILQAATCAAQPGNPFCPGRMGLVREFLSHDPEPMVASLLGRLPVPQSALQAQWMAKQAAQGTIGDPIGDAAYGNPRAYPVQFEAPPTCDQAKVSMRTWIIVAVVLILAFLLGRSAK